MATEVNAVYIKLPRNNRGSGTYKKDSKAPRIAVLTTNSNPLMSTALPISRTRAARFAPVGLPIATITADIVVANAKAKIIQAEIPRSRSGILTSRCTNQRLNVLKNDFILHSAP